MKKPNMHRGSVLMEFVIMLPIYMLILGFTFLMGDFSLESIHLASSADRTYALGGEAAFDEYKKAASPDKDLAEVDLTYKNDAVAGDTTAKVSDFDKGKESKSYVADSEFDGPWVEMAAAKIVDSYTLPPWTRALLEYWYREDYQTTEETTRISGGIMDTFFFGSGLGRVDVSGKDLSANSSIGGDERKYGFYTLQRCAQGRKGYRTWGVGSLLGGGQWDAGVWHEIGPDSASKYSGIDGSGTEGKPKNAPAKQSAVTAYSRDDHKYKKWCE